MRNRAINLFIQDHPFQVKLITILVIAFLQFLLLKEIQVQGFKLLKLRQELSQAKEALQEVPRLEEKVRILEEKAVILQSQPKEISFALKGIFIQDNTPIALIGEDMYRENDSINGFVIAEITPNYVVLEDKATQLQSILRIPE
ncbi:MAG: hypothetical protein NT066_05460 [Candidatus Omnitrophica bacterium]|nr:hypothetical protein [Candidatus Omnitrophota bacterium]